ncbi:glutamine amidotransferase-related protein [Komagataeibacter sp. FNDCF1]|uniref:glutamine amidotransferase-related protein n=1 Tax=Komagataeibacter sp. FNDCF1 TaxID=2878681 RepID=UPI001E3C7F35|nr:gamma-glutamyl-gamma-aminobutyrate hydrolase family protein [Komagataeibacter sp. FNDCF1]MCE2563251.1 gamma-glutamyl-gamma-aminobutyrate hydrolase family protein [Komagataeibacter sp. FNDCF1]
MTLIMVRHDTGRPGLYGAAAGVVARALDGQVMHGPVHVDETRDPDGCQHVGLAPERLPSGLLHAERLTGRTMGPVADVDRIMAVAAVENVVVPYDGLLDDGSGFASDLLRRGACAGMRLIDAGLEDDALVCRDERNGTVVARAWQDGFGRFHPEPAHHAGRDMARHDPVRIALIGTAGTHHTVYPGALAALGDAAEALGVDVDVTFIDPAASDDDPCYPALVASDGVLLPGGAAAPSVRGQIRAAGVALAHGVPVMGLCLGMQTMTTAFARLRAAMPDVAMAEVAEGKGTSLSFRAHDHYRLGINALHPVPDTELGAMLADGACVIRSNHRYVLNTDLLPPLCAAGLRVAAWNDDGTVVEGIELPGHPFYMGMQGHPELTSAAGRPHPLCTAFVQAARVRHDRRGRMDNRKGKQ